MLENKEKKICSKCEKEKELDEFGKDSCGKFGRKSYCKECKKKYDKKYRQENKVLLYEKNKEYRRNNKEKIKNQPSMKKRKYYVKKYKEKLLESGRRLERDFKVCYVCGEEKEINCFTKDKYALDGHTYDCKECRAKRSKKYKNTEQGKEVIRKRERERLKTDEHYRLKKNISRAIQSALKSENGSKNGKSSIKRLPYTIEQLKKHLETQFESWMNWNNYGGNAQDKETKTWWIDHIIPQSALPYNSMEHPNFERCWALENLRPLDKLENMKKGDRIDYEINMEIKHYE